MIEGLSHITFIVRDLDRMEQILTSVLSARKVYDSGNNTFSLSREKFFLVGAEPAAVWVAIMEGESRHSKFSRLAQPDGHDTASSPISTGRKGLTVPRVAAFNTVVLQKFLDFRQI